MLSITQALQAASQGLHLKKRVAVKMAPFLLPPSLASRASGDTSCSPVAAVPSGHSVQAYLGQAAFPLPQLLGVRVLELGAMRGH